MRSASLTLLTLAFVVSLTGCRGEIARALPTNASSQLRMDAKGCDKGDLLACHNVALEFDFGDAASDERRALAQTLYTRACDAGMTLSCRRLAHLHVEEAGGDVLAAMPMLLRTCSDGDVDACADIADIKIRTGSAQEGFAEYLDLCHRNSSRACIELGRHLLLGTAADPDPAAANAVLDVHCVNGSPVACHWKAEALLAMTGSADEIGREITHLLGQACLGGESFACRRLAGLHERGVGVERDTAYARSLLRMSCEHWETEDCGDPLDPPTWAAVPSPDATDETPEAP